MSLIKIKWKGLRSVLPENSSALFLILASCLIIAGMCASVLLRKHGFSTSLCFMLVSAILGIAAIALCPGKKDFGLPASCTRRMLWMTFFALTLAHCALTQRFLQLYPGNTIDTFTFQQDACRNLIHGLNPYEETHADLYDANHTKLFYGPGMVTQGRVHVGFQYPPLTFLWALPGYVMGDIRYSYVLAVILSAFLWLLICPTVQGLWLVGILLLSPLTFAVENRCWTEPLVLLALTLAVYAAVKRRWWLPIALGVFLATKQYNILALPFFVCFIRPFEWRHFWKLTGWSITIAIVTVLPFACWNLPALWHDLVLFHLAQPFRQDALSLAVPFPIMLKIGPLFLLAFLVWATRNASRNAAMFAVKYGVALLLLIITSKQAFANYYFLASQAFLLAVAALPPNSHNLVQRAWSNFTGL